MPKPVEDTPLNVLMGLDPLKLTREDEERIVDELRARRHKFIIEDKNGPSGKKKENPVKVELDLDELLAPDPETGK